MIKIVTREHWRDLVDERNNAINERNNAINELKKTVVVNKAIGDQILDLEVKLDSKNAEIKKLKALLTKNKIDYKHLYKGGK